MRKGFGWFSVVRFYDEGGSYAILTHLTLSKAQEVASAYNARAKECNRYGIVDWKGRMAH